MGISWVHALEICTWVLAHKRWQIERIELVDFGYKIDATKRHQGEIVAHLNIANPVTRERLDDSIRRIEAK